MNQYAPNVCSYVHLVLFLLLSSMLEDLENAFCVYGNKPTFQRHPPRIRRNDRWRKSFHQWAVRLPFLSGRMSALNVFPFRYSFKIESVDRWAAYGITYRPCRAIYPGYPQLSVFECPVVVEPFGEIQFFLFEECGQCPSSIFNTFGFQLHG